MPIFEQLQLEEALLRSDNRSFCIINQGSPRAIVMGISGQPKPLLNMESVKREQIPIIKRFSGGGTVIVDEQTLFITFIMAKDHLNIPAFPEAILRWSANLYTDAWKIPNFHLQENDFCIGEKKCGGNAQYIQKNRWLHHTSFLWDYSEDNMNHLLLPAKQPQYRQNRPHEAFLTRLKEHTSNPSALIEKVKETLVKQLYTDFKICNFDLASWKPKPHRQSTQFVSIELRFPSIGKA